MKTKVALLALMLALCSPLYAWNKLFPEASISSRTINWTYDNTCTTSPLPELLRATRIWDRLLVNVTINYQGVSGTGFNYTDNYNTVSCHNLTWFSDGTGAYHRANETNSGAFVDHSINNATGERLFDMAFRDDIVTADGKAGAALHEWTHVLGLDHSTTDHWSAVYYCPFGSCANPYSAAWSEYPSNDDIVGLSNFYGGQAADCTPYLSTSNKLYLPYIPATANGNPNPNASTTGYWAVLQWNGAGTATMLEYGTAATYPYNCSVHYGSNVFTGTGYAEASQSMVAFTLTNNDPTGASVSSWTITSP